MEHIVSEPERHDDAPSRDTDTISAVEPNRTQAEVDERAEQLVEAWKEGREFSASWTWPVPEAHAHAVMAARVLGSLEYLAETNAEGARYAALGRSFLAAHTRVQEIFDAEMAEKARAWNAQHHTATEHDDDADGDAL